MNLDELIKQTLDRLNIKLGAFQQQINKKTRAEAIQGLVEAEIKEVLYNAFRQVNATDTRQLRIRLSLMLHPDRIEGQSPKLFASINAIDEKGSYDIKEIPQKVLNEIDTQNPYNQIYHFFDNSNTNRTNQNNFFNGTNADRTTKRHSHTGENKFDDPEKLLFSWLEYFGNFLSQHHRYPELVKNAINFLYKVLDFVAAGLLALIGGLIVFSPQFFTLIEVVIISCAIEIILLQLYLPTDEMDKVKDGPIGTYFKAALNAVGHLLDTIEDKNIGKIIFRALQVIVAPVLILSALILETTRFLSFAALYSAFVPAILLKIVPIILINSPLYAVDIFRHLANKFTTTSEPPSEGASDLGTVDNFSPSM